MCCCFLLLINLNAADRVQRKGEYEVELMFAIMCSVLPICLFLCFNSIQIPIKNNSKRALKIYQALENCSSKIAPEERTSTVLVWPRRSPQKVSRGSPVSAAGRLRAPVAPGSEGRRRRAGQSPRPLWHEPCARSPTWVSRSWALCRAASPAVFGCPGRVQLAGTWQRAAGRLCWVHVRGVVRLGSLLLKYVVEPCRSLCLACHGKERAENLPGPSIDTLTEDLWNEKCFKFFLSDIRSNHWNLGWAILDCKVDMVS